MGTEAMRTTLATAALITAALIPGALPAQAASQAVTCRVSWFFEFDHSGQAGQKPQAHASDRILRVTCTDHRSQQFAAHNELTCAYTGRLFFYRKVNGNGIVTVRGRVTQARCPVILPLAETAWIVQAGLWVHFANGWKYAQDLCVTKVPDTKIIRKCGP